MFWLLFLMTVSCLPANRCDWEKKNSDNICYGSYGVTFYPNTPKYTQIHPNTPKYTQIQFQIILFLLFWDVLRIINDSLSALSLFFHEFQQNSQVFTDLRRVAYNHEYTQISIKILSFKSLIYMNYFYIFTEILILKTILGFLRLMQLI